MNSTVARSCHTPGSGPLNWDNAVRLAATVLSERYVLPDIEHHPARAHEAQRLAALLCAYGKLDPETNHGLAIADEHR
jgi:hypothetical protein